MNRWTSRLLRPVRRQSAEVYLLLMLLSFAASLTLTRLLLYLTGYPQLGGANLHIAHVLWGGLILFVAALLPLIFVNRWAHAAGAVLSGLGIGLFIDEVGKFITQSNDYFYPGAAPLIYAFFLLAVLLYLRVRRPHRPDARAQLYHALDTLEEVLDHHLEPDERDDLLTRLRYVSTRTDQPDLARLAQNLLAFASASDLHLTPETSGLLRRWEVGLRALEARWLPWARLRVVVILGLASLGGIALFRLGKVVAVAGSAAGLQQLLADQMATGHVASAGALGWLLARMALEGAVGILLVVAAILVLVRRERAGLQLGSLGLLLTLTTVNLLVFYFEQFSTIAWAVLQFGVLLALMRYQRLGIRRNVDALRRISERKSA